MQITKVIQLPNGAELTVNLNDIEVQYTLEVGLNCLVARGALPFAEGIDYPQPKEAMN